MSNEQYLIASYFGVGLFSLLLGLAPFFWLRKGFRGVARGFSPRRFFSILRQLFPVSLILPSLFGFLSVSYEGCERPTYQQIIADRAYRSYLIGKNQEQLSNSLTYSAMAVLIWGFIVLGFLIFMKRRTCREGERAGARVDG